MSKILGKIFGNAAGGVVEKLAGVADKFITTGDEKRKFQKEMETIFINAEAEFKVDFIVPTGFKHGDQ